MTAIEELGLIKMDFLGLRTLTVIRDAERAVRTRPGYESFDTEFVPIDDAAVYAMLSAGDTSGVFQMESAGMTRVLREARPNRLEDLIAVLALYRPGPMESISLYIRRRFHPDEIRYKHPALEPILRETHGIMVYQEQVMQVVQALAGFSLGRADILRRAMSKKKPEVMDPCLRRRYLMKSRASPDMLLTSPMRRATRSSLIARRTSRCISPPSFTRRL